MSRLPPNTPRLPRKAEASIWVSELTTGRLPQVCVKSGLPAETHLSFGFEGEPSTGWLLASVVFGLLLPFGGGHRAQGPLPLTHRWRRILQWSRVAAGLALPVGGFVLLTTGISPPDWHAVWVSFGLALLAASLLMATLYGGLKPKGEVFKTPEGERWLRLREIHPNFASAVAAMDHAFLPTPLPAGN